MSVQKGGQIVLKLVMHDVIYERSQSYNKLTENSNYKVPVQFYQQRDLFIIKFCFLSYFCFRRCYFLFLSGLPNPPQKLTKIKIVLTKSEHLK